MANSKSELPGGARVLVIHGDDTTPGNVARVVDHGGHIYIEVQGRHRGETIYTLTRVSRDRFVTGILGWLL